MIKNEKQYKITKSQANGFKDAIESLGNQQLNVKSILIKAQENALRSQYQDLIKELEYYEALQSGKIKIIEIDSFENLPLGLIQARIARGMSQKDLALKLNLQEQQIQRYEATDYSTASFQRLKEIIQALNVKVKKDIFISETSFSESTLFKNLERNGLEKNFVLNRLLSPNLAYQISNFSSLMDDEAKSILLMVANVLGKIFKVKADAFFSFDELSLNMNAITTVRYKKTAQANALKLNAYTVYAHILALNVLEATKSKVRLNVPESPSEIRSQIFKKYSKITFEYALDYVWGLGIPVIVLNDSGAFHGACWRIENRNVIVLKQKTLSESKWLFDLFHELCHAGQYPELESLEIIETEDLSRERVEQEDEIEASYFAADILLGENSDDLAIECITLANGNVNKLKSIVPEVAKKAKVDIGALANFIAFRLLKEKNINWWGAANNLQKLDFEPWDLAKIALLNHVDLNKLNEIERNLILKAI